MRDMRQIIEDAWTAAVAGYSVDQEALIAQAERLRVMRMEGYAFRLEILYSKDGSKGGVRIGLFDKAGPVDGLVDERCYTNEGTRNDRLLHLLVDVSGRAPLGW